MLRARTREQLCCTLWLQSCSKVMTRYKIIMITPLLLQQWCLVHRYLSFLLWISTLWLLLVQVGKLAQEMKEVKSAANLSLDRIHSSLNELERGVELVNREIEVTSSLINNSEPKYDRHFLDLMVPFAENTKTEIANLNSLANSALGKLKDLAAYFGETMKEERQTDLFKTMREFLFMFNCVSTEIKSRKKRSEEVAKLKYHQTCRLDVLAPAIMC